MLSDFFRKLLEFLGLSEKEDQVSQEENPLLDIKSSFQTSEFFPEISQSEPQNFPQQESSEKTLEISQTEIVEEKEKVPVSPDEIPVGVERHFWPKYVALIAIAIIATTFTVMFVRGIFASRPTFGVKVSFLGASCSGNSCLLNLRLVVQPNSSKANILSISNFSIGCHGCKLIRVRYLDRGIVANLQLKMNNRSYQETCITSFDLRYKVWFFTKSERLKANVTINLSLPGAEVISVKQLGVKPAPNGYRNYSFELQLILSKFEMPLKELVHLNVSCDNPWIVVQYPNSIWLTTDKPAVVSLELQVPPYVYLLRNNVTCIIYSNFLGETQRLARIVLNFTHNKSRKRILYSVQLISGKTLLVKANTNLSCSDIEISLSGNELEITNCSKSATSTGWTEINMTLMENPVELAMKQGIKNPVLSIRTPYFNASINLSWTKLSLNFNSLAFQGNANSLELNLSFYTNCSDNVQRIILENVSCELHCLNLNETLTGSSSNINKILPCNDNVSITLSCKFDPSKKDALVSCISNSSIDWLKLDTELLVDTILGSYLEHQAFLIHWNSSSSSS